eukprot:scaffold111865_cov24-Prasinocladus_malaysianus.AAC.1
MACLDHRNTMSHAIKDNTVKGKSPAASISATVHLNDIHAASASDKSPHLFQPGLFPLHYSLAPRGHNRRL